MYWAEMVKTLKETQMQVCRNRVRQAAIIWFNADQESAKVRLECEFYQVTPSKRNHLYKSF